MDIWQRLSIYLAHKEAITHRNRTGQRAGGLDMNNSQRPIGRSVGKVAITYRFTRRLLTEDSGDCNDLLMDVVRVAGQ